MAKIKQLMMSLQVREIEDFKGIYLGYHSIGISVRSGPVALDNPNLINPTFMSQVT